ncbi:TPA: LysR family transcriptional regulator [Pseudomonas putida]|uniref:Transcriptional regulator, LysR family n=1 Tax=Pseudomonas putida (strain GB-1) TaxID=76869 RepID=B0KQP9_PSEPG|nr:MULTISPECIES: LysR family transcriptional regulator [Pseudomonas]ABY98314.1 transcriptional regulator, LysR family [Pseudomonas putida GB-1]APE98659.1 transcriptional regulator [Pseudomonas putida]MBP0709068.1 LysR family transcriptional regulator [Pseudomonas sp. T34]MCE1002214.1 LysR family transcriptional regulator [Pseudomonas sp. NMI1173_11]MCK2188508.1 LysR family transcriptional regulator [Pseudomonas sp. MB04B]
MRYSPEALVAFVEAASLGSFSAAARKLRKSQSTISIAIANFETDIGCPLFDRGGRHPTLNEAGRQVLSHVEAILDASAQLDALAVRLAQNVEPLVSVVMSDSYSVTFQGAVMARFAQQYSHTELRCGPAEDADVIEMIQQGLAHVGILATQPSYPADVAVARLPEQAEFGVYVASGHPLASLAQVQAQHLEHARQLYIKTYAPSLHHGRGQAWSAPDYLTLLEFAVRGFGWAELPRALVARFGNGLVELPIAGYPRRVDMDVVWSSRRALGPAGQWLVRQMLKP